MQNRINRFKQLHTARDYYAILDIDPNTPDDQVEPLAKQKFKKLALEFHPDRCQENGAGDAFKAINEAKEVLTNSVKLRAYKAERNQPRTNSSTPQQPAAQSTYAPRARPQPGWTAPTWQRTRQPSWATPESTTRQTQSSNVRFGIHRASFTPVFFMQPQLRVSQQDLLQALIVMAIMETLLRAQLQRANEQALFGILFGIQRNAHYCRANDFQASQDIPQHRVRVR